MNARLQATSLLVCCIGLGASAAHAQTTAASSLPVPPANLMSLSAAATQEVTMDTLTVTLAVVREGQDAALVQTQLRQVLETALAEARKAAKPKALEVQTGSFSLNPRYATQGNRSASPTISGWTGRAELLIEGRDLPAVAQLAGRLNTLTVARVGFALSRDARERVEEEATQQAIARFRTRAEAHSRQFGFSGYQIREVQVGLQDAPSIMARAPMMRAAAMPPADEALPVEAGKTTVSVSVSGTVQMVR